MSRSWKVTLRYYDKWPETKYIKADNKEIATLKARRFFNPESNCREFFVERIAGDQVKAYNDDEVGREESYADLMLTRAEHYGITEYEVNGRYMEYWSFYPEGDSYGTHYGGFFFIRHDIITHAEDRTLAIKWNVYDGIPVPKFLQTKEGWNKYNYMIG